MNAALPARQGQLAAASERADAQLAEVKRLEIRFRLMVIVIVIKMMDIWFIGTSLWMKRENIVFIMQTFFSGQC